MLLRTVFAFLALAIIGVRGHAFLATPLARSSCPSCNAYCPHCMNAGGVGNVRTLSINNKWPYPETDATTVRHGMCGDPANSAQPFLAPGPIVATYTAGQEIDLQVYISTNHVGHFIFRLCDTPNSLTETCFSQHKLQRVELPTDPAPLDANYPDRWYLPPTATGTVNMRFRLPYQFSCTHCVLQWWWVSANSCIPPGYRQYAAVAQPGWTTLTMDDCGTSSSSYPEEFWNCADVTILPSDYTAPPSTVTTAGPVTTADPSATTVTSAPCAIDIVTTSVWGSGFNLEVRSTLANTRVEWDWVTAGTTISSIWNGVITQNTGNHVVVTSQYASTAIGMSLSGVWAGVKNVQINSVPCGATGPTPPPPPPSTAAPSTAAPSTAAPSTAAPSTAAPSTAAPSPPSPATPSPPPTSNKCPFTYNVVALSPSGTGSSGSSFVIDNILSQASGTIEWTWGGSNSAAVLQTWHCSVLLDTSNTVRLLVAAGTRSSVLVDGFFTGFTSTKFNGVACTL